MDHETDRQNLCGLSTRWGRAGNDWFHRENAAFRACRADENVGGLSPRAPSGMPRVGGQRRAARFPTSPRYSPLASAQGPAVALGMGVVTYPSTPTPQVRLASETVFPAQSQT